MAGGEDARDTVTTFEYDGALIGQLRTLDALAHVPPPFWDAIEGTRFSGELRLLPDGELFRPGTVMASLSGRLGEVLLFRHVVDVVLAYQVGTATSAHETRRVLADAVRAHSVKDLHLIDGGSRWTEGHGWSLWMANALDVVGGHPYPFRFKVLGELAGSEFEIEIPNVDEP